MKLGVCYYPEHWPESAWARDAREMRGLGLSFVRIGEFAWSRIEPARDRFAWDWLDRAIDTLANADLEIVLGTPTATPPRWLVAEKPEILAVDAQGRRRGFGSRRHYCFSSAAYRAEAVRIARILAERYGRHQAITSWQIDNEYGCHSTVLSYSAAASDAFRAWCAAKYGSVEALNAAWGNVFWSMDYAGFEEIDPPSGTVTEPNPAHVLDWRRFSSDQVIRFNQAQVEAIKGEVPEARVVHNVMGFFTDFDHRALASGLDGVAWDSYPLGFLDRFDFAEADKARWARTGHPDIAAYHHDLYRGLSDIPFGIMEQQPGPVNWAPHNPVPLPGMVRFWTLEALAHGASYVSYFRWRQCPFAQEQMHAGLRLSDDTPSPAWDEVAAVAREIAALPEASGDRADIALVFDYESEWVAETQPQGREFSHVGLAFAMYSTLRRLGFDVDIIGPKDPVRAYRLVVVPCLPILDAATLDRLTETEALVLFGPRSGSKTAEFRIPDTLAPGPLGTLMGFSVPRVESLRPGTTAQVGGPTVAGAFTIWREYPRVSTASVLAHVADGTPALLAARNLRYLAGWPDEGLLRSLLATLAREVGLVPADLPDGLRLRRRGGLHFAFNSGPEMVAAPVPAGARILVGGERLAAGEVAIWQQD